MQHRQEEKLIEFIYFYRFKSVAGYTRETYVESTFETKLNNSANLLLDDQVSGHPSDPIETKVVCY